MQWRSARAQRSKYADGPRTVAKHGPYTLEVFEWCSVKNNTCPSGEFSYVVIKRGRVAATGPHGSKIGSTTPMLATRGAAQNAAERRVMQDPSIKGLGKPARKRRRR